MVFCSDKNKKSEEKHAGFLFNNLAFFDYFFVQPIEELRRRVGVVIVYIGIDIKNCDIIKTHTKRNIRYAYNIFSECFREGDKSDDVSFF